MNQKYLILSIVACVVLSIVGVSGFLLVEYIKSNAEEQINEDYVDPNWFYESKNTPSVSQYYEDPQETKKLETKKDTNENDSFSSKNEETFSRPSMIGNYALPAIILKIKSKMDVMLEEDLVSDTGNSVTGIIQNGKLKGGLLDGVYVIQHETFFIRFTSVFFKNKRYPIDAVAINDSNQKGLEPTHTQKFHTEKIIESTKALVKDMFISEMTALTGYGSNVSSKKPIYTLEKKSIQIRLEQPFKGEK